MVSVQAIADTCPEYASMHLYKKGGRWYAVDVYGDMERGDFKESHGIEGPVLVTPAMVRAAITKENARRRREWADKYEPLNDFDGSADCLDACVVLETAIFGEIVYG